MTDMVHDVFGGGQTGGSNYAEDFSSTQIKIVTAGFGGAGCNIVNRLLKVGVKGTEFVAVNTDAQHFKIIDDRIKKVLIGKTLTRGLGAGGDPEMGAKAAEVDRQRSKRYSRHTAGIPVRGMGGGTGTGAIPVAAQIAKEQGAIVVAMVTYPFDLERVRKVKAEEGIQKLRKFATA